MSDHSLDGYALGLRSNGYLIKQTVTTLTATAAAIADGSIAEAGHLLLGQPGHPDLPPR
jgi:hypothetical protein